MVRQAKTQKLVDDFFEIVHENYNILDEAPVQLEYLKKAHNMPNKWNILLDQALDYYIKSNMEF